MNIVSVIVIFVILLIVAFTSKKHSNIFLAFGLFGNHTIKELADLVNKILPDSIPAIINHYLGGTLATILMWGYIILMVIFFIEVTRIFARRY